MGSSPEPTLLEREPGGLGTLLRAALPSLPVLGGLPGVRKAPVADFTGLAYRRPAVRVARAHVDAYAAVCGFPVKDTVPLTYPHVLAFGLHMAIMSDPAFPFPAIGTVHLANSISRHRPIAVGEELEIRARVGPPRPHPKGALLEFETEVRSGADLVWTGLSTYLRRGVPAEATSGEAPPSPSLPEADATGPVWRLPADLGRRYAGVSGDHNPIHLHPLTAKALGFPRQIAHGMWSKARCVAALENRLPDAVRVEVSFRKPILLPGRVAFGSRPLDDGYAFSLTRPDTDVAHLLGRTTDLS